MTILLVATKSPFPPTDGGRLLTHLSVEALRALGHRVIVVAPCAEDPSGDAHIRPHPNPSPLPGTHGRGNKASAPTDGDTHLIPVRSRSHTRTLATSWLRAVPVTIARHSHHDVRRAVHHLVASESIDVVHVEQLQGVPQAGPAVAASIPVVLREQNIEAVLWDGLAKTVSWARPFAKLEGRRVRAYERHTIETLDATIAVTPEDAQALRGLSRTPERIHSVSPPFPAELPAASRTLSGEPAIVVMGSQGWLPNEDGARWFVRTVWPFVASALRGAELHLFGLARSDADGPRVEWHPSPAESRDAFAPGAILAVPQRMGSGVRMKILEAWSRGVPVVSTRAGAAGLEEHSDGNLVRADTPEAFAQAFTRLHRHPEWATARVRGGRETLRAHHDPTKIARRLEAVYASVVAARGGR